MEDLLRVGVISSAHGIKGEVNVFPTTDEPEMFAHWKTLRLVEKKQSRLIHVRGAKYFKNMVILSLEEIADRNQAELLRQAELYITRDQATPCGENENFITDLIGLRVVDENKEEGRQQVRCEFTVLRTDTALYNIIVHHHDKHLHKPDETTGSGTSLRVLAIPVRHTQNDEKQQCAVDEQSQCHLRDGDVQRAYFVSGGIILHQLAFVLASCGSDGKAFITSTVLLQT